MHLGRICENVADEMLLDGSSTEGQIYKNCRRKLNTTGKFNGEGCNVYAIRMTDL